jgi:anti-anti-sigma regulatory factor
MGPIIEQVSEGILEIYFPEPLSGIDLIQLKKELYEEINIPNYTVIQLDLSNCGGDSTIIGFLIELKKKCIEHQVKLVITRMNLQLTRMLVQTKTIEFINNY